MAEHHVGTGCEDCLDGACTMNCSSAEYATGSQWIAASIWSGVFPQRATAHQIRAWKLSTLPAPPETRAPIEQEVGRA